MNLNQLKPSTLRRPKKRVGRGGKRGTFSGGGTKGQKSRAGAGVKPGFRGGDNRIWQLFPKQRGASKKPGNARPHKKHRYFQLRQTKPMVLNLDFFNRFNDGDVISPKSLDSVRSLNMAENKNIKVLGSGNLSKKITFEGFTFSESAREKITKSGGVIK